MQIQALFFKELSTHNPMDGSIFRVNTHTLTHTERLNASHTLLGIRGHVLSLINIPTNWHIHAHMRSDTHTKTDTRAQRESPPLQHGCYISSIECFKLQLGHNNFKNQQAVASSHAALSWVNTGII